MHPWKKIIRGKTEELKERVCFICLERITFSDDDIELKMHLFKVHFAKVHLIELVKICTGEEERERREGWSLDDILEEERDRREAEERKRAQIGGCIGTFWRKKRTHECLDNMAEAEISEVDCFLCQEKLIVKSCEYDKHLENQHGAIFGLKEIKKAGERDKIVVPNEELKNQNEEAEPEIFGTDADTVKELVEMKYLPKKKKIKFRTPTQRLFSRKYQVLIEEEEVLCIHNI